MQQLLSELQLPLSGGRMATVRGCCRCSAGLYVTAFVCCSIGWTEALCERQRCLRFTRSAYEESTSLFKFRAIAGGILHYGTDSSLSQSSQCPARMLRLLEVLS